MGDVTTSLDLSSCKRKGLDHIASRNILLLGSQKGHIKDAIRKLGSK